jgi:uracil-DNA glycosylase
MLAGIDLQREDVYITNIVKYRPPNNRDPLPEEKEAFLPYLRMQLDIIKPKLIVTLGRHSMLCFLPGMKISDAHGKPKRIELQNRRSGSPGVDTVQGAGEERKEAVHIGTASAHHSQATQQRTTSNSDAASFAGEHGVTTWVILPLYHPAAALYNGAMRQLLIDDFAKIPNILYKVNEI